MVMRHASHWRIDERHMLFIESGAEIIVLAVDLDALVEPFELFQVTATHGKIGGRKPTGPGGPLPMRSRFARRLQRIERTEQFAYRSIEDSDDATGDSADCGIGKWRQEMGQPIRLRRTVTIGKGHNLAGRHTNPRIPCRSSSRFHLAQ